MFFGRRSLLILLWLGAPLNLGLSDESSSDAIRFSEALTQSVHYLCPQIRLFAPIEPSLTPIEKRLVCGDSQSTDLKNLSSGDRPWAAIPVSQAIYHLRIFLEERGYHHPRFERSKAFGYLEVDLGSKTFVRQVTLEDGSEQVNIHRKRDILGQPLTPDLLNDLERWVRENLKAKGYPCPLVRAEANTQLGEVILRVNKGNPSVIRRIQQEPIPGVNNAILRRFDAFQVGEPFNGDLLSLTESRVAASGIVESARFSSQCSDVLEQTVIPGAPRLMISRIGLNTEGVILGSFSWRNARFGKLGSFLDLSAFGSARRQTVVASMNYYYDPAQVRAFLAPQMSFTHRNELQFENLETNTQFGWSITQDSGDRSWSYFVGPTLNLSKTLRGLGASELQLLSLEGRVGLKSHDFELFSERPQSGYQLEGVMDLSHRSLLSQVTAQRIRIKGEWLWNHRDFDPPLWVIGLRGNASSVLVARPKLGESGLPADFFQYLGGSRDLRGFGRLELSESLRGGGLSSATLGIEARLSSVIPYGLDPFLFLDIGLLGTRSLTLDSPFYWSPGLGVRWASPIGAVRATAAHGFAGLSPMHLQFYFGLGEEF